MKNHQRISLGDGLWKRGGHYWVCVKHQGKQYWFKPQENTERAALKLRNAKRRAADDGKFLQKAPDTVQACIDALLKQPLSSATGQARTNGTKAGYRTAAARWAPLIGELPVQEVTWQQVEEARDTWLNEGLSPTTVRLYLGVLRSALSWAVEHDLLLENVANKVPRPKAPKPNVQPLTAEEAAALFLVCLEDDSPIGRYVAVSMTLALRAQSEVRPLLWRDVSLDGQKFKLDRSFGRGDVIQTEDSSKLHKRWVVIPEAARPLFAAQRAFQERCRQEGTWLAQETPETALVWTNAVGDKLSTAYVQKHFRRLAKKAGIPETCCFYDATRHTPLTLALAAGFNLADIKEMAGHSRAATTLDFYAKSVPGAIEKAANAVADGYLGKATARRAQVG